MKYYKNMLVVALSGLLLLACGEKSTSDKTEPEATQQPQTSVSSDTTTATLPVTSQPTQIAKKPEEKVTKAPQVKAEGPKIIEKPVDEQITKPQKFITTSEVSFESRGFTSDLFDLHFIVINKSKYSYKNMKFKVDFYDEDATLISSQTVAIDAVVGPGKIQTITKGVNKVKGTETVKMRCTGANVAN